jgi:2-hydroxychromene-2-carboxylate isomerase
MTTTTAIPRRLDFYFSFASLWTYIGFQALEDLLQRQGLDVVYKPIDLHAIFKAGGGLPVKQRPPQRQAYRFVEMQRWRDIRGIPLVLKPQHHPSNPEIGHRMLLAALAQGQDVRAFVRHALRVLWVDDADAEDAAVMVKVADRSGLDGAALLSACHDPAILAEEQRLTLEAVERQVFGTPFFFYRDEPFWGQDRLDLLEAAIISGREPIAFKPL